VQVVLEDGAALQHWELEPLPQHTSPALQHMMLAPGPQHVEPAGPHMATLPPLQHTSPALQHMAWLPLPQENWVAPHFTGRGAANPREALPKPQEANRAVPTVPPTSLNASRLEIGLAIIRAISSKSVFISSLLQFCPRTGEGQ